MSKYLDSNGLLYFWGKIKAWVEAKGYTTNTGTITSVKTNAGAHTTITKTSGAVEFNVPTKTSHLNNDAGFLTEETDPVFSASPAAGIQATDITNWNSKTSNTGTITEVKTTAGAHTTVDVTSGMAAFNVPTKVSHLTNDTGFTTNIGTITGVTTTAGAHTAVNASSGNVSFNVPTKTSHLTNDSNFAVDASYVHTDNNFTTALKNKLNGIEAGAEANLVKSVDSTAGTSGLNLSVDADGKLDATINSGSVASGNANFVTGGTVYNTTKDLAPKASPSLTGTPTAPTAAAGTNNTQIATTAFVTSAIATAQTGAAMFQGTVTTSTAISGLSDYKKGWYWVVGTAGTYVGQTCEIGDMIYCISDYSSSYKAADFSVVQTNLDIQSITNAEIDAIAV